MMLSSKEAGITEIRPRRGNREILTEKGAHLVFTMPRFSLDEKQHPSSTPCPLLRNSCVWRLQVFFRLYIGSYLRYAPLNFESSVAIILQPMDVIKTKQQGLFHKATLQSSTDLKIMKDMRWQASAKAIYKERGVLGYWDGLVSV